MRQVEDLKPCPFCGQTDTVVSHMEDKGSYMGDYQVVCNCLKGGCGSSSGYWYSEEEAIDAWNRRVCDQSERDC